MLCVGNNNWWKNKMSGAPSSSCIRFSLNPSCSKTLLSEEPPRWGGNNLSPLALAISMLGLTVVPPTRTMKVVVLCCSTTIFERNWCCPCWQAMVNALPCFVVVVGWAIRLLLPCSSTCLCGFLLLHHLFFPSGLWLCLGLGCFFCSRHLFLFGFFEHWMESADRPLPRVVNWLKIRWLTLILLAFAWFPVRGSGGGIGIGIGESPTGEW